jgi:hypothetical protein
MGARRMSMLLLASAVCTCSMPLPSRVWVICSDEQSRGGEVVRVDW